MVKHLMKQRDKFTFTNIIMTTGRTPWMEDETVSRLYQYRKAGKKSLHPKWDISIWKSNHDWQRDQSAVTSSPAGCV
jgi:hypothetical protein